jgi:hypothetical protein
VLELPQTKQKKAIALMSEMGEDLTDVFRLIQNDILNLVNKAESNMWTLEKLEIEMESLLIDEASEPLDIDGIVKDEIDNEDLKDTVLEKTNTVHKIYKAKNAFDVESARNKIKGKYNASWRGKKYERLISQIITENQVKIANSVLKDSKKRFTKNLMSILPKTKREKVVVLPDLGSVIERSPTIIKAAQEGVLLTKTLRERMRTDIKNVLISENITTKKGTVNKNIQKKLQKELIKTYENYTKKNPKFGMPNNIRNIAVTESRSIMNNIRYEYIKRVESEVSSEVTVKKRWVQNRGLSRDPRESHNSLAKSPAIGLNEQFNVNGYMAFTPHDARLPASESIGCSCELK